MARRSPLPSIPCFKMAAVSCVIFIERYFLVLSVKLFYVMVYHINIWLLYISCFLYFVGILTLYSYKCSICCQSVASTCSVLADMKTNIITCACLFVDRTKPNVNYIFGKLIVTALYPLAL